MMKKYHFVLEDSTNKARISGDAYTLRGIRNIFKRVNVNKCEVYRRTRRGCASKAFLIYQK